MAGLTMSPIFSPKAGSPVILQRELEDGVERGEAQSAFRAIEQRPVDRRGLEKPLARHPDVLERVDQSVDEQNRGAHSRPL